ncbi:galactosylgalactosylxylosylprotein 3-beta-glucuronosyltransferase 1 [Xenopus laevis]|uniref:Galactosylgalactosylxylosylprotein 3-beta-glucuronosyltransferase n=1 Tax=Xenopus laevis TaxID=8355 RepID=A0A8J1N0H4_XENLA|nr:galactosylgalactosylxylosylprotein 3-beta-glucuronosyltransferase 1 [Xenopus laevis]
MDAEGTSSAKSSSTQPDPCCKTLSLTCKAKLSAMIGTGHASGQLHQRSRIQGEEEAVRDAERFLHPNGCLRLPNFNLPLAAALSCTPSKDAVQILFYPIGILLCLCLYYAISVFTWNKLSESDSLPIIFAITPTYPRHVQKAELTRIANTFRQIPAFHWIVVEDTNNKTSLVTNFLKSSGIQHTQLCVKTPPAVTKARGTLQRNVGLSWLRETFQLTEAPSGVVYFADDDNTYSLKIFEEMRYTKKVSVWPVGFAGGLRYESLVLNDAGKVKQWRVRYDPSRPFAIDMAGFAVNLDVILEKRHAIFRLDVRPGYQESSLLQDLATMGELEPKADNCTKVLVWHTKTQNPNVSGDRNFTDRNVEV